MILDDPDVIAAEMVEDLRAVLEELEAPLGRLPCIGTARDRSPSSLTLAVPMPGAHSDSCPHGARRREVKAATCGPRRHVAASRRMTARATWPPCAAPPCEDTAWGARGAGQRT